jgi:hypothetical protein
MATQGLTPEQQIGYLQIELAKAKQEATRLRKALHENNKHARRVDRAYEDALLLASWRVAGIIPSRRYARLYNITQHRWESALALLKLARIVTRQRHWAVTDLATIERNLANARSKALDDPGLFFLRLPRTKRGGV